MKIKRKLSFVLIILGVLFITYSVVLLVQNQFEEKNAKDYSQNVMVQLTQVINKTQKDEPEQPVKKEDDFTINVKPEVTNEHNKLLINNSTYIGILNIPSLGLELPIQSQWSYPKMKNTPCVYKDDPFSIAAHNYSNHFGRIHQLKTDDKVTFTDVNATQYTYKVVSVSTIKETNIDALQDETFDLSLFTCNLNDNTKRTLVRLMLVK